MSASLDTPQIESGAWVAPSALLTGKIEIADGVSIWHNAVLRAETQCIQIGRYTNLQDFVMVHVGFGEPTVVGEFCSITHHTTIHGCTIEDHCLVGINVCIMDGARIGKGSIVAGGAFVPEGREFPPGSIIAGVPAKVIAERDSARPNRLNAWQYHRNAGFTARGEHRAWDGPEYEAWLAAKSAEVEADRDL